MEGVIQPGFISAHILLDDFREMVSPAYSDDLQVGVHLAYPNRLNNIMNRTFKNRVGKIFVPGYLTDEFPQGSGKYRARLLIPPNITKDSPFFLPGLVIPDITVVRVLQSGSGYFMTSNYLGDQELYAPPTPATKSLYEIEKIKFIGIIEEVSDDPSKPRPKIRLIKNSGHDRLIFEQHMRPLEIILSGEDEFWFSRLTSF